MPEKTREPRIQPPSGRNESGPLDYPRKVASTAMDIALLYIQHKAGMEAAKYELHAALLEALTNKASVKRWRNGKAAFPSVRDKSMLEGLPFPSRKTT